jgi:hypothetical protein
MMISFGTINLAIQGIRPVISEQLCSSPDTISGLQLLSMVRSLQGRTEEALGMAMKVLDFRRKKFGGRFKTCDSLCRIGDLLRRLNRPSAALCVPLSVKG